MVVPAGVSEAQNEAAKCEQLSGQEAAKGVRRQAIEARDGFASALEGVVLAYGQRVSKISDLIKLGNQIIKVEGPDKSGKPQPRATARCRSKPKNL